MATGTFVPPTLIELASFDELKKEVFGPVLHVVRYNRNNLNELVEQINASGYGLTLGVHTRIDETIAQVTGSAKVGNLYVNRNMVGAVVGVQPFGGEGLRHRSESGRSALPVPSAGEPSGERAGRHPGTPGCGLSGGCAAENRADPAAGGADRLGGKTS
jgi:RHH-type proline utilization regulon transcriptional repressor/proline dehydrogenase/delta 1-pyrroline-5-carboxylate dehydrogenase